MLGLVQSRPFLISEPIDYASTWHGRREIVSRDPEEAIHRSSYTEVATRAKRVANALDALGAGRGDRVAMLAWNGWRHLDIYYDVTSLGPFPANKGINRIAAEGRREPTYAEIVDIGDVSMKMANRVLNANSTRSAKLV